MTEVEKAVFGLLTHLTSLTVLSAALGWVATKVGEHYIAKRFKAYESELGLAERTHKATLDRDLELHRSALNLEHVKHSRIHERLLDVMLELNRRVVKADRVMREATALLTLATEESFEDRRARLIQQSADAINDVDAYFEDNRILFTEATCRLVEGLREEYQEAWRVGSFGDRYSVRGTSDEAIARMDKEAWEQVREHIPPLRRELEREFRQQLGVTIGDSTPALLTPAEAATEADQS